MTSFSVCILLKPKLTNYRHRVPGKCFRFDPSYIHLLLVFNFLYKFAVLFCVVRFLGDSPIYNYSSTRFI